MPLTPNQLRRQALALAKSEVSPAVIDKPCVLCLLQNQWFKEPERIPRVMELYRRHLDPEPARARFVRDMLFLGCLTGRRIREAFGEERCMDLTFEEVSLEIGDRPSSVFPPDLEHVTRTLEAFKPRAVVLFGAIAASAVRGNVAAYVRAHDVRLVYAPHPAARGADTLARLRAVASEVEEVFARHCAERASVAVQPRRTSLERR